MKKITSFVLLGAGIILSLAGCQKGPENGENGKKVDLVQFKATSMTPGTRTAYGEEVISDGKKLQPIDWTSGDKVLVWSDKAVGHNGNSEHFATYEVLTFESNDAHQSIATVEDASNPPTGLVWTEGESTFKFSGCYPNDGFIVTNGADGYPVSLTAEVDGTPTLTDGCPDMKTAYMLATPVTAESKTLVDLHFQPYFTTFELNVTSKDAITINKVTVTSEKRHNGTRSFGPSVVSGSFTAAMDLADGTPAWVITTPEVSTTGENRNDRVTVDFTSAPLSVNSTTPAQFKFFAVPQDITSLTFDFEVEATVDGETVTQHRRASLAYAKDAADGRSYAAGDPVTFAARKKHNINLTLAPINKDVELILKVMPWEDEDGDEVVYGPDAIITANALEYVSGAAITSGGGRRRNNNFAEAYAADSEGNDANPIWGYFYIFAPYETTTTGEGDSAVTTVDTKWEITVTGAVKKMDVNVTSPSPEDGVITTKTDDKIVITGPTGGRVDFEVSRLSNTVGATDEIQLNFAVIMKDGRKVSINSEITRRNALTISGKVGNN